MRLREIISEEKHYAADISERDLVMNPEAAQYFMDNEEYYKKHFADGNIPVFSKPQPEPKGKQFTNKPPHGSIASPGYRGLHMGLKRAGIPHDESVEDHIDHYPGTQSRESGDAAFNRPLR